jgi:hypothetical protein
VPIERVKFAALGREYSYKPWDAFTAISEWGEIGADLGEGIATHLLDGDLSGMIEGLGQESGVSMLTLQALIQYLGDADLGDRVGHYLTSARVHLEYADADGGTAPLCDANAGDVAAEHGLTGLDLLAAAWYVVREGLRPLLAPLLSIVKTTEQGKINTSDSSNSAESA